MEHSSALTRLIKEGETHVRVFGQPVAEGGERVYFLLASAFIFFS